MKTQKKIRIELLNEGCKITKCYKNESMEIKEIETGKVIEVMIRDICSEQSKDILFEFSVPKMNETNNDWSLANVTLEYENLVSKQIENVTTKCHLARTDGIATQTQTQNKNQKRNIKVDMHFNRIQFVEAMAKAVETGFVFVLFFFCFVLFCFVYFCVIFSLIE